MKEFSKKSDSGRWLRTDAAEQYFQVGRYGLEKIASACNGKKHIGSSVVFDKNAIEKYLDNQQD